MRLSTLAFPFAAAFALASGPSSLAAAPAEPSRIIVYPAPDALKYSHHIDDFTVRVRTPGGAWRDLFEYKASVDLDDPQNATMATFDMEGPVEVWIRKNNGAPRSVRVRPANQGIGAKLQGDVATFTLTRPAKISVEFDGDRLHNLHLFANPIDATTPDKASADVIWFGPGVHMPGDRPGIAFNIPSNKTVYIDGGAVLQGKLVIDQAKNVRIVGHGIIDNPERGFEVTFSEGVVIDGPIVLNPQHYSVYCGQSSGLRIHNLKAISAKSWSDGLDFMSCSDVTVDDVFLRNSDDTIAIYTSRWNFSGDARNFKVSNAILWADKAHGINIGLHGDPNGKREIIEDLHFSNIDILEHDESDANYQGAFAISDGDNNLVRRVTFDTIRVDDFQEGQLFNFRVVYNAKYSHAPGAGIEDILVRNVSYSGANLMPSVVEGYDADRSIKNVRFEKLTVNGRLIDDTVEGNIQVGKHVSGVSFSPR
jgi:hypothetical protein